MGVPQWPFPPPKICFVLTLFNKNNIKTSAKLDRLYSGEDKPRN